MPPTPMSQFSRVDAEDIAALMDKIIDPRTEMGLDNDDRGPRRDFGDRGPHRGFGGRGDRRGRGGRGGYGDRRGGGRY